MLKTLVKNIHQQKFIFTNYRALIWEEENMLIISDLHIGKSAHFRKYGIAVSSEVLERDLVRLKFLIQKFSILKVIVVGDLFHAGYNTDLDIFKRWRSSVTTNFMLVRGNHDRLKDADYELLNLEVYRDHLDMGPFRFEHEPKALLEGQLSINGHIHPGVAIKERQIQRLRLPCFAYTNQQLILPAFSRFTGLDCKSLSSDYERIAFGKDVIFQV